MKKEDNVREEMLMPLPEHSAAKKKKKKLTDQIQSPQRIYQVYNAQNLSS